MSKKQPTKQSSAFLFSLGILILFLLPIASFAGFGISPPLIQEDRLVKGSRIEETIYLVQGDPTRDVALDISIDSRDIADWISFKGGDDIVIPAGVQQFPLDVIVTVPEDADLGLYKAFIRISTKPERATGDGEVAIALGGRVDVELEVGEGVIYEYVINGIEILDIEEGGNPTVSVNIENTGNVPASPEAASFELFNKFGNVRLAYMEAETFEKVDSFSTGDALLTFPIGVRLAAGEYWGHVRIHDDEGSVVKELRTVFNVHEKSSVFVMVISTVVAALVLVIIGIFFFLRKRSSVKRLQSDVQPEI